MKINILLVTLLLSLIACTTASKKLTGKELQKDQILFFLNNYENGLEPHETTLSNLTEYDYPAYKNNNKIIINEGDYVIKRIYTEVGAVIMACELALETKKGLKEEEQPPFLDRAECIELVESELKNPKQLPKEAFADKSGKTFGWDLGEGLKLEMIANDNAIYLAIR